MERTTDWGLFDEVEACKAYITDCQKQLVDAKVALRGAKRKLVDAQTALRHAKMKWSLAPR